MKQFKLVVVALFALLTVGSINAQDENNPWAVSFGVNIVDYYNPDADFIAVSYTHLTLPTIYSV